MSEHESRGKTMVPYWLVDLLKLVATGLVTAILLYARVGFLESKVDDGKAALVKAEAKLESQVDIVSSVNSRVGILETRTTIMEKSITESLSRIETDLRDVKSDIKQLQRAPK